MNFDVDHFEILGKVAGLDDLCENDLCYRVCDKFEVCPRVLPRLGNLGGNCQEGLRTYLELVLFVLHPE